MKLFLSTSSLVWVAIREKRIRVSLAAQAGANIVAKMAVLAEGDAMDRGDIIALDKLPVFNPDGTVKD